MLRTLASVAVLAASASAYVSTPALSGLTMSASRREVVQAGAGVAAVTPFLNAASANAARSMPAKNVAPIITVFDHRGCDRATLEYQGAKANGEDDYMCIKVKAETITVSSSTAAATLNEVFGLLDRAAMQSS